MKLIPGSLPALCWFLIVACSPGEGHVMTWQSFQRIVSDDDSMSAIPEDSSALGTEYGGMDDAMIRTIIASALRTGDNAVDSDSSAVIEASLDNLVGGCSHGKCQFCTPNKWFKVCLEADVVDDGFQIIVSVDGRKIFDTHISVLHPKPICLNHFPGFLKDISDICLVIYNVDLQKLAACVKIEFKVKIGFIHHTFSVKISCFDIPHEQLPWDVANEEKSDEQRIPSVGEMKGDGHSLADRTQGPTPMMVLMGALRKISQVQQNAETLTN